MTAVSGFLVYCQVTDTDRIFPIKYLNRLLLPAIVLLLLIGGCTTTRNLSSRTALESDDAGLDIVLMPLDVELYILTAGGLLEPQAEWTGAAREHMLTAIRTLHSTRGTDLLLYEQPDESDPLARQLLDIERLHSAVGMAILTHEYQAPLPSKKATFDWSLGDSVSLLRARHEQADYALFIFVRDSYSSAGRVFMQLAAAALGVGIPGGQQIGFASLVDLRSGEIVWFNRMFSEVGDLRTEKSAVTTVKQLLRGLPE